MPLLASPRGLVPLLVLAALQSPPRTSSFFLSPPVTPLDWGLRWPARVGAAGAVGRWQPRRFLSPDLSVFEEDMNKEEPVSPEFVSLCNAQFDLLKDMANASMLAVYFRRENPQTGELEFMPVAVLPESDRVWVVASGSQPDTEQRPLSMPGSTAAGSLIPEYPFTSLSPPIGGDGGEEVGEDRDGGVRVLEDGGLSAPLVYGNMVVGMVVAWKRSPVLGASARDVDAASQEDWRRTAGQLLRNVAKTLSVAAVLDQQQRISAIIQTQQLRQVLAETLHQVKNPLTALRTFGKLLLRRLDDGDSLSRELAKDMIIQSDRLVDLLVPVDDVLELLSLSSAAQATQFFLPPSSLQQKLLNPSCDDQSAELVLAAAQGGSPSEDGADASREASPSSPHKLEIQLCFVNDVLGPIFSAAKAIATRDGVELSVTVAEDLPGIRADPRALQEAVSNVLDNALRYIQSQEEVGQEMRVAVEVEPTMDSQGKVSGVAIQVADNGKGFDPEELSKVFHRGFRGKASANGDIEGSGLGLAITQSFIEQMGGRVLVSNIPEDDEPKGRGGARVVIRLPRA
mmetsp:Transcript_23961/g.70282  ORF Transcript_23961/g.70282 Transcript_23961/m.70282 type:complete len:569 (-) Transcript_23961:3-1709(-)